MEQFLVNINQLIYKTNGKQKTVVRSFVTKPSPETQVRLGKIFGLIEIESASPKISTLIDVIISELKEIYYGPSDETEQAGQLIERFEKALKKTNVAIASFIEGEQIQLDLEKINIVIGLIYDQELHLAQVGKINAILLYCQSNQNFRIINIIESSRSSLLPTDALKIFSQVISGKIRPKDILFISTDNLLDYFSQDRLKSILTSRVMNESLNELKKLIEKINSRENFGALALELEKSSYEQKIVTNKELGFTAASPFKESMEGLIRTERETEKFLAPSLLPEVKKIFINFFDLAGGLFSRFGEVSKEKLKEKISAKTQALPADSIFQKKPVKNAFGFFTKFFTAFFALIKIGIAQIKNRVIIPLFSIGQNINHTRLGWLAQKFMKLPRSSRILLVVTIILAVLFLSSLTALLWNNYQLKSNEKFNQIILEIESKKNNAASSLIYRDENLARKLLIEAQNSLNELKPATGSQRRYLEKLGGEIEDELKKMRHWIDIPEPVQLANFENLNEQTETANWCLLVKNTIFTQNLNNQALYKYNLDTRITSAISAPNEALNRLELGLISENDIFLINSEKRIFKFSPGNDTVSAVQLGLNPQTTVTDLGSFKNYLYVLDNVKGQIYRLSKTDKGFENPSEWVKADNLGLNDAAALAVDGSVYVLKKNGEVIRLANGKQDGFKLNSVEPELRSPTKIKTTDFSKYLYVIEPTMKRIVVISKETGNLVIQYASDKFIDLKDIGLDEANKKIYVLAGNSIYGIAAEHLK